MSSSGSSLPRLGPTWSQGGRGFQPPPPVPAERITRGRSGSGGSKEEEPKRDVNKFAALDEDDDDVAETAPPQPTNSRVEGLRSQRSPISGTSSGRSLADLAARVPAASIGRSSSSGYSSNKEEGGRFTNLRSASDEAAAPQKVIRFTRERLLSLRSVPDKNAEYPPAPLQHLEGSVILSKEAQDPVCWDNFEPDEIWAVAARERLPRSGSIGSKGAEPARSRRASSDTGAGRWQRGVALPPPDESKTRARGRDSDNPNELWDDPLETKEAAADFSAFGAMPEDGKSDAFDLNDMAEATRRFEMERHGSKGSDAGSEGDGSEANNDVHHVDPKRPLASVGTTIQSGSGNNVNVFEDFGAPSEGEAQPISKGGDVDVSASSRLMKMIGVANSSDPVQSEQPVAGSSGWGSGVVGNNSDGKDGMSLSMNPWGDSLLAPTGSQNTQTGALDLAARLEAVVAEQKVREAAEVEQRKAQEAEILRHRQAEESRRRSLQAQNRSEAAGMPQQHSQVELVLIERIATTLEKSWGRSDLGSILGTLHAGDSRVIPLLGDTDALRALIARHPKRIQLQNDPSVGAEMAVLLVSNAQWQQHQQHAQARAEQDEIQRREQIRMQEMKQAAVRDKPQIPPVAPDAPWFYSDPQKNIQGPFRGEEMRQWFEAGYFKGDLPISQQPSGPFVPLSTLFPDLSVAFRFRDEAREKAATAAEQEQIMAEQRAEARASEAEAQTRVTAAASNKDQSSQLKTMLGMGTGGGGPSPEEQPTEKTAKKNRSQDKKQGKLHDKATVKVQHRVAASPPAASQQDHSKQSAAAWGGASRAAPRKSMSEIQQEEARVAARLAMERKSNPRSSSGGWANIASSGGGSSGWSGGAVKPTPAAVVTNANTDAGATQLRSSQTPQTSRRQTAAEPEHSQKSTLQVADEFGASMPPALQRWCKDQMRKLNGSEDLTLVSFCMSLSDQDEIRQYLTAYLGSTPQVNNFATEFIKRKDGKKQQDEWETPAVSKKSKKKSKGGIK